jgi:hypothetical protein
MRADLFVSADARQCTAPAAAGLNVAAVEVFPKAIKPNLNKAAK